MSTAVATPVDAPEKEWTADREATLEQLRIVDMVHEGKPACRLCGQIVNRLDTFGLCSKTSDTHQQYRGYPVKKARKR